MSLIKAKEALENRATAIEEMRNIQTQYADNWTDEAQQKWDKAEGDEKRYLAEANRYKKMAELESEEKEARQIKLDEGGNPDADKETQEKRSKEYRAAFGRYIKQKRGKGLSEADHKILSEGEKRAQTVGTNTQGGYLMPEGFSNELDRQMKYYGGMIEASRNLRTATGNPIPWPTVDDTNNVGAIITETTDDSEQDVAFGSKTLNSFTYTSRLVLVSWELLQDSYFNVQSLLSEMLGERLGRIVNQHLTKGLGGGTEPTGVATASTLGVNGGGVISRANIVDLIHSVNRAYRQSPNCRLMFNDQTLAAIKKLSFGSADDRPLWQPSIQVGEPDRLEGFQYIINDDLDNVDAGKSVLFGDFSKYVNRTVRDIELVVANERYVEKRSTGFFAYLRADGQLINTSAIKHLTV